MSLSTATFKVSASAKIAPPYSNNSSGAITLTKTVEPSQAAATNALAMRIYFGASLQTAEIDLTDGTVTLSATGTRQVETCTVTAASGATSSGNLALTLTSAAVTGSPLAITVPLTTTAHTTAALIADAIVKKLNATPAVTDEFRVTRDGADVILTSIYALANDATLNLAITAGLGVSAVSSSTNTTSGSAGVVVERIGGDGEDVHGVAMTSIAYLNQLVISNSSDSAAGVGATDDSGGGFVQVLGVGAVYAYGSVAGKSLFSSNSGVMRLSAGGVATLDVLASGAAS